MNSNIFTKIRTGLTKTRQAFSNRLTNLLFGQKQLSQDLLRELENLLLTADLGATVTKQILSNLTVKLARSDLANNQLVESTLKNELTQILIPCEQPLNIIANRKPFVILTVGVNGAGKTTTIGKLAKLLQNQGKQVMLAAGDTFRAAAIEQLKIWGERNNTPVVAQQIGADSASVLFDALQSATAKNFDVLIADTAGRLHTQNNLMAELQKIIRVIKKLDPTAPHEVLLVLDAGIGQNALAQVKTFHEAVGVTGLVLTKLDGTAKGGIIFAIAQQFGLPIRFVGTGEHIDNLNPFEASVFTQALFTHDDNG